MMIDPSALAYEQLRYVLPHFKFTIGNIDDYSEYNISLYNTSSVLIVPEYAAEGLVGFGLQVRLRGRLNNPKELILYSNNVIASLIPTLDNYPVYVESYLPGQLDPQGRPITTINLSVWEYGGFK